jgi:hypothetical protein
LNSYGTAVRGMKGYGLEISRLIVEGQRSLGTLWRDVDGSGVRDLRSSGRKYLGHPYCYSDTYSGKEFEY